ncbi:MAG: hypothetical protein NXI08_06530 [bacterium]|nr:hypothetical protein [bacterium]
MRNLHKKLILLLIGTLISLQAFAQEDDELYVFGFAQVLMSAKFFDFTIYESETIPVEIVDKSRSTSFTLHQVNLFFQKPITERSMFFLSLEASGSYSTSVPSGNFQIPEGWISYRFSDQLEVKAGLLLPKFNNLTEIKNRLPLFPYLIRPVLYETMLNHLVRVEDYKPQNAYFQLTANKYFFSDKTMEIAFYVGNAENSFLAKSQENDFGTAEENSALYRGENLNTALLFGSRIGIINDYQTFKTGISFTYDEDNKTIEENSIFRLPTFTTPVLGEVKRYRVGYDLSFAYKKVVFEGEYMGIFHNHKEIRKTPAFQNANLNKRFLYGNITYNFNDEFYAFGYTSFNSDQTYEFIKNNTPSAAGIQIYSLGGGWKPFNNTSIKAQYLFTKANENDHLDYRLNILSFGISTIF